MGAHHHPAVECRPAASPRTSSSASTSCSCRSSQEMRRPGGRIGWQEPEGHAEQIHGRQQITKALHTWACSINLQVSPGKLEPPLTDACGQAITICLQDYAVDHNMLGLPCCFCLSERLTIGKLLGRKGRCVGDERPRAGARCFNIESAHLGAWEGVLVGLSQ